MRVLIILISTLIFTCNQQAQNDNQLVNNEHVDMQKNNSKFVLRSRDIEIDKVIIDTVPDIPKYTNEKSPAFIKTRLEALVGNYLRQKCNEHHLNYPPKFVLFRFFKYEKEFEVWAGNSRTDSLRRILLLPVCAVDDVPGTKLEEGDGKTPEGFYNSALYYGSSNDFMWIKLNNSEIDTYGNVSYGSSFKMCLDYPNSIDRLKTKTIMKHSRTGSAICIHGNCVSIGCISFKNRNYLPVFLSALGHNTANYGTVKIHILPFRYINFSQEDQIRLSKSVSYANSDQLIKIWNNLEEAYNLFNAKRKAIKISTSKSMYEYSTY